MLQNAYLVAKIGADTAENEQQFAEILPIPPGARRPRTKVHARRGDGASRCQRRPLSSQGLESSVKIK